MITLIDTMALLLTFFIMIYAMSAPDVGRFKVVAAALVDRLGATEATRERDVTEPMAVDRVPEPVGQKLDYLNSLIAELTERDPLLSGATTERLSDRLVLSLPHDLAFTGNSARLTRAARRAVSELAPLLNRLGNRVEVAGHSDPEPIRSGQYSDNWELSLARAAAVAAVLAEAGYTRPLQVVGFADARFTELAPELDRRTRNKLARRVDLVIFPTAGSLEGGG